MAKVMDRRMLDVPLGEVSSAIAPAGFDRSKKVSIVRLLENRIQWLKLGSLK